MLRGRKGMGEREWYQGREGDRRDGGRRVKKIWR